MRPTLILAAVAAIATGVALAATSDPNRMKILDGYAAQAKAQSPDFAGFSADRGRALYMGPHSGGTAETPACATCHTQNPAGSGRHYKTGRAIEPMAVSANPTRFTDATDVEKRFERDCVNVLGRACTAREKGDFITFLATQ
jgi:cytochrome c peroxidase